MVADRLATARFQGQNQLRIAVDNDIGIMCHHDHLSLLLDLLELGDNQIVDKVVVQIIFGLVQNQRLLAVGKQEGQ